MIDIESSTTPKKNRIIYIDMEILKYYSNFNVLLPGMQLIGVELVRTIYEKEMTCFITCYTVIYISCINCEYEMRILHFQIVWKRS